MSVWLHLLEDTPDWLLWIEFGDNPIAQWLNSSGKCLWDAVSRGCAMCMNNMSPMIANNIGEAANTIAEVS